MKDLYSALGIAQSSSNADIVASNTRTGGQDEAAAVLLNPDRRAVYDTTFKTLKTIGSLRHRLGMDTGDSTFIENHPDFVPSLKQARTSTRVADSATKPEAPAKSTEWVPTHSEGSGKGTAVRTPLVLGLAVIVAVSIYFLVIR